MAIAISKSKKIQATNGVNIIQIIINMLTQMMVAIMTIIANIPQNTIPSTIAIESRMKNIANTIAVIMRHIERAIPEIKHIMVSTNEMAIIKKVNPAQPSINIVNARANIVNPNRHKSIAVTIPVPPIHIIESERHRTIKAKNVIVRARQMIHNAKNGIEVHITHKRALMKNAREQRKHALADKHNVKRASTRAIRKRQIIIDPKITHINPPNGNRQHPTRKMNIPRHIIASESTMQDNERHIMNKQKAIIRQIKAKIPQINITTVTPKHRMNKEKINAISPHNIIDRAKQATTRANGSIEAHIIPSTMARNVVANANKIPIAPKTSRQRKRVGEQTTREQIQDSMKVIRQIEPTIRQIIPIMHDIAQIIIANIESPIQVMEQIIPSRQKIAEIMNVNRQMKRIIKNAIQVQVVMMHIIPIHKAHKLPNTNPVRHSSMQRTNPIIVVMKQINATMPNTMAVARHAKQRHHPTTIAKMIMTVIMRTIVLIIQRINGTITQPNQPIMIRSIKANNQDIGEIITISIKTTIRLTK